MRNRAPTLAAFWQMLRGGFRNRLGRTVGTLNLILIGLCVLLAGAAAWSFTTSVRWTWSHASSESRELLLRLGWVEHVATEFPEPTVPNRRGWRDDFEFATRAPRWQIDSLHPSQLRTGLVGHWPAPRSKPARFAWQPGITPRGVGYSLIHVVIYLGSVPMMCILRACVWKRLEVRQRAGA